LLSAFLSELESSYQQASQNANMASDQISPELSALLKMTIREPLPEDAVNRILSAPPFLQVPLALNLRTISAPSLAPGIIYRSGALSHLPPSSLSLLKSDHNITTIFDLRSRNERERSAAPQIDGIETIWVPSTIDIESVVMGAGSVEGQSKPALHDVKPADFVANNGIDGYIAMYGNVLKTHINAYQAVFERLRDGEGGVLFHCTAGKDRTGILAALIHALLESPEEVIAEDYVLTRIGVEPFRERLLQALLQQMGRTGEQAGFDEPGVEEMCGTQRPVILAFLNSLDEKYVSVGNGKYAGAKG
jgi:protein tyrosine/serine phosphatase